MPTEIPMMYFKRSATTHLDIENAIDDMLVLKLLFHEMTFNVVYSLYPCEIDEAALLAAVHIHLAKGAEATKEDVL